MEDETINARTGLAGRGEEGRGGGGGGGGDGGGADDIFAPPVSP